MRDVLAPFTHPIALNAALSRRLRRPKIGEWELANTRTSGNQPATWRQFKHGAASASCTIQRGEERYVATATRRDMSDPSEQAGWFFLGLLLMVPCAPLGILCIFLGTREEMETKLEISPVVT